MLASFVTDVVTVLDFFVLCVTLTLNICFVCLSVSLSVCQFDRQQQAAGSAAAEASFTSYLPILLQYFATDDEEALENIREAVKSYIGKVPPV